MSTLELLLYAAVCVSGAVSCEPPAQEVVLPQKDCPEGSMAYFPRSTTGPKVPRCKKIDVDTEPDPN